LGETRTLKWQRRGAALALPEDLKRIAEIVKRRCPIERHAIARHLLECRPEQGDGIFEARGAALALPEGL
jgi:hypothetical protein